MASRQAILQRARMLSSDVRELTLDPGPGFTFVPGQWVSLKLPSPDGGEILPRSYSIASWPRADGCIDLAVTRVSDGPGSNILHELSPGAVVTMSHAQGFFTMPDSLPRAALLVATGTGVAPLRAMVHAAHERGTAHRVTLLLGVRSLADVLYRDDFMALARTHPGFTFEPTLSRPSAPWTGRTGYVQSHLRELTQALAPCDVYVCGVSAMVQDVRRVLKDDLGFTRENIHTERYD